MLHQPRTCLSNSVIRRRATQRQRRASSASAMGLQTDERASERLKSEAAPPNHSILGIYVMLNGRSSQSSATPMKPPCGCKPDLLRHQNRETPIVDHSALAPFIYGVHMCLLSYQSATSFCSLAMATNTLGTQLSYLSTITTHITLSPLFPSYLVDGMRRSLHGLQKAKPDDPGACSAALPAFGLPRMA